MLKVYGGFEIWGTPDLSPPCCKLKTYLRMAEVPYEDRAGDPRKGPTKKIPYIDDDGTILGDSNLIVAYLKKKYGDPLDARLSKEEAAKGFVIRKTLEESFYWHVLYPRWFEPEGIPLMKGAFARFLPPVIGGLIMSSIVKQTQKSAWGQGLARHTRDDIYAMGKAELDAFSTLLGDRPYLFGDTPTSYDASLFGEIANVLGFPTQNPLKSHAETLSNLVAFRERVTARYWDGTSAKATKTAPGPSAQAPAATA
jgi:glutathione S-transferase